MPRHHLRSVFALIFILAATACDSGTATPSVPPATPTLASTATSVAAATTQPASPTALIPSPTGTSAVPTVQPALTPADTRKVAPGCPADRLTNSPRDGLGDELFPKLGNAGYDVQHYELALTVDVDKDTLDATAALTIVALKDLDAFNLDFRGLTISKLTVNGTDAAYTRDEHELTVTTPAPLKSGQTFTLEVAYSGEPISASRNGSPTEGWTDYKDGVYVAGEPDGASTVYPVNEHPCDKATYSLKVTVPKPYVVASVGHLDSTTDDGSTSTYTWSTKNPVASYLVGLNIGLFDIERDQSPDGVPIRSYFPKDLPAKVRDTFSRTPEMVQFLTDTFGPYPFEEYGVVVADTSLGFALETQTMSLFGNDIGTGRNPGDETALHELAHQWFGDSVSLEQWHDIWLNEGFATYAQWLWIEHNQGKQALEDRVRLMYSVVNEEHGIPPGSPTAETLFNPGVYLRGGLTLQALRLKVGDDAFFKILKTYAARYRHSNATTKDFIAVSEEVSGMQLDDLFDSWLHDDQMPSMPELGLSTPNSSVPPSATVGSASTAPMDLPASGAWQRIDTTANTTCARGTPYAFWARAGKVNKLLVYFQGGGGCWNYDTCKPGSTFFNDSVSAGSDPSYNGGMLDLANPDNPFKDYSIVYVPYCTGDVHMGSYTQTYKSSTGEQVTIRHNGFVNSSAAVQWAYEHFVATDSVFVAGCSAGSIGSIVFAPYLIKHYDRAVVAQLGDSESFTFDHPVDLQTDWHAHDNFPNWIPDVAGIKPGTFTMPSFYAAIANFYPNSTFSQYNSAHDTVQQRYYFAAALPTATPPAWEEAFQRNLAEIRAAAPNFRSYTSDGSNHCVTPTPGFYTMSQDGVSLRDWIASIANSTPIPNVGQ